MHLTAIQGIGAIGLRSIFFTVPLSSFHHPIKLGLSYFSKKSGKLPRLKAKDSYDHGTVHPNQRQNVLIPDELRINWINPLYVQNHFGNSPQPYRHVPLRLKNPEVIAAIKREGYDPVPMKPQPTADRIKSDFKLWGKTVKSAISLQTD
jgi:hypothetical protein